MLRTHTCGELSKKEIGKKVTLSGWIDIIRTHGKIGFVNLRDKYGITQLFFNKEFIKDLEELKRESIIQVTGKVKERPKTNEKLKTGTIEVAVEKLEIFASVPKYPLGLDDIESTEKTRMKYRYLDLKDPKMQSNLLTRHKMIKAFRDFLDKENFVEIETPLFGRSTPEGARDYLIPSRVHNGSFYALPQSPQLFKQLLVIGGVDKYFQIAKCMRDEDLRADRQPEFTQLDLEMSFVEEEDIYSLFEKMIKFVWKKALNIDIPIPFDRLSYEESMKKYKSEKPDLRKKGEKFKFVWITEFPLFEYDEESKRYVSAHHPFTGINKEDLDKIGKSKEIRSRSYDLVLNGWELGSGSIRIHDQKLQSKVFDALGMTEKEAREKFGFFLDALKFAPPHGGFAIGIDRIVALATENESIREVIAFPKNKDAKDLMTDAPNKVDKEQLDELGIKSK